MDIQFLPDVEIICPDCGGRRYAKRADEAKTELCGRTYTISELMNVTAGEAVRLFEKHKKIREKAEMLTELGLGYLTLGESTPALSGGEARAAESWRRERPKKSTTTRKALRENTCNIFPPPGIEGVRRKKTGRRTSGFGKIKKNFFKSGKNLL